MFPGRKAFVFAALLHCVTLRSQVSVILGNKFCFNDIICSPILILVHSHCFPATFFHEGRYDRNILALIIFYEQLLEFRHFLFRDDQETASMSDQIMICKNNRRPLVTIQKYLSLHAIQAQLDSDVDRFICFFRNLTDFIFYIRFIRQRRNIR